MKKMICKQIKTIQIQGINLVEVVWTSETGRVEATSRAQSLDQYVIGQAYIGKLGYTPHTTNRVFQAIRKSV